MNIKIIAVTLILAVFCLPGYSQTNITVLEGTKGITGGTPANKCPSIMDSYEAAKANAKANNQPQPNPTDGYFKCLHLLELSIKSEYNDIQAVSSKATTKTSTDGIIKCVQQYSYTVDYKDCLKVLKYYNAVTNLELAMDLQQKVRSDLKFKSIQDKQNISAKKGDLQGGALDAGIEVNDHMKAMNIERVAAYGSAVLALGSVYKSIPGEKAAIEFCEKPTTKYEANEYSVAKCKDTVKIYSGAILANQDAKEGLAKAITKFLAKGVAAGLQMRNNQAASNQIAASKKMYDDAGNEILSDRCTFNPTDPACAKKGERVSGERYKSGDFVVGENGSNSFDMSPSDEEASELGAATDLDGSKSVAGINSPFVDQAKEANGIINPAAAAQMQPTGGAKGGGPGGGGAGGGGGGASLGNDLKGEDKDGNKENQIKTTSLAGNYEQGGGGGFRAPGKEKDDANPFASLFDSKSEGAVEEDASINLGDIDGASSGLFQKISKRYGLIQADKRIEANNLE